MVRRRQRERSVWEVVLPDADKLWPDALRRIDDLIDDEALVEVVAEALERRWPQSRRRGRPGTPAEVVVRMLVTRPGCSDGSAPRPHGLLARSAAGDRDPLRISPAAL